MYATLMPTFPSDPVLTNEFWDTPFSSSINLQEYWAIPAPSLQQRPSLDLEQLQPAVPLETTYELPIVSFLINGTSGDDNNIEGTDGNDTIFGKEGNDYIFSKEGLDSLYGGDGDDWLYNGWGDGCLYGENDNDYLYGGGGDDELWGGEGDDILLGAWHNDRLYGGAGDDIIRGSNGWLNGSEIDILTGDYSFSRAGTTYRGEGADTFMLNDYYYDAPYADIRAQYSITPNGDGYAIITDFNRAEGDRIQVRGSSSNYRLQTGFDLTHGQLYTSVFYKGELVSIVQNTTNLSLTTDFNFV